MLYDRPGNGQSVKGTGSPADFIQDQQAVCCGVAQNGRHLCHLHHERTLSAGQIVGSAHTGENPVHNPDFRFVRRHETADLRHQHNERRLPHIGGLSRHIRARDNGNAAGSVIQIGIIGNKHIIGNHLTVNSI